MRAQTGTNLGLGGGSSVPGLNGDAGVGQLDQRGIVLSSDFG
jgi:hypothetical protein